MIWPRRWSRSRRSAAAWSIRAAHWRSARTPREARLGWPSRPAADRSPFERLDFTYMPSCDVARDLAFYRDVLGGEVVFPIEAIGTRVAPLKLAEHGPRQLLSLIHI